MNNLRIEKVTDFVCGNYIPITILFREDVEVTAVWEVDGLTYWEDGDKGTVCTGTVHDYTAWLTEELTKTA